MMQQTAAGRRTRLNRNRVLESAVDLADQIGIEALTMRRLAQELDVVPMALYKHVANKEELLDGMVEVIIGEIDLPVGDSDWRSAVRQRVLSARRTLQRHGWARRVIESRTTRTGPVLEYTESIIAMFFAGGLSTDLTHHAMHALGGRMWGFTQELFEAVATADSESSADSRATALREMGERYPNMLRVATASAHDDGSTVGRGCDDQFEFEFSLDLLLDGIERLREQGWISAPRS